MTGMPQLFFHSPVFYDIDLPEVREKKSTNTQQQASGGGAGCPSDAHCSLFLLLFLPTDQSTNQPNQPHEQTKQYKAQFIAVTVASALALTYAYVAVASAHEAKLLAGRCVRPGP